MGVTVATTRVFTHVIAGDQEIRTTDLNGLVPKAAFFIITSAQSDGVPRNYAVIGIGAATAVDEQWALCVGSEHGAATTDTYRRGVTDECVLRISATTGVVYGEAAFVAFIADGVTINWGNPLASPYLLTVVFFAGTDLSAQANVFTLAAAQDAAVDVNTVGFEPDVLLTGSHSDAFDDASGANAAFSHGAVVNKDSVGQYCYVWYSVDGAGAGSPINYITDDYGVGAIGSWAGEFGGFDANGFSCTTRRAASGGDEVGFLALAFGGTVEFEAGIINSPTANGNQSETDPGFTPQYVHVGLTQLTVIDTEITTGDAGSVGISVFDENDEYCNSIQDEDAADPTDTQSLSDDTVVNLPNDDGTVSWVASFISFIDEGWTWNFTATEGTAVRWWYLAVGMEVPEVVELVLRNLMYIEQVTYREPYGLQLVGGDDERLEVFLSQRGLPNL